MGGRSSYDAIERWHDIVTGKTDKAPVKCSNIVVSRDRVYSYGTHFELARALRDKKGNITGYLLNGDRYSVTTSKHQWQVRRILGHEEQVIIPYSALDSAGIDRDTVRLIHRLDDRWVTTEHRYTEFPPGAAWYNHRITERRMKSDADIGAMLTERHARALADWAWQKRHYAKDPAGQQWLKSRIEAGPPVRPTRLSVGEWDLHESVTVGYDRKLYTRKGARGYEITVTEEGGQTVYSWTTGRHWLGESLIRARTSYTTNHRCTECGGFGTGPKVQEHGYRWELACDTCSGRGQTTKTHHRWAYYLSGFDHQEARELYFFCELPYGCKPTTVDEAYEVLKPEPVKMAEQMNRPVFRQGDIFGVPIETMNTKVLKALKARIERRVTINSSKPGINLPYILNTNHTATEVAYLPNGVTLARGVMYHDPSFRQADHARRRLGDGKTWHVVIKNTVPVTIGRR